MSHKTKASMPAEPDYVAQIAKGLGKAYEKFFAGFLL